MPGSSQRQPKSSTDLLGWAVFHLLGCAQDVLLLILRIGAAGGEENKGGRDEQQAHGGRAFRTEGQIEPSMFVARLWLLSLLRERAEEQE